jgi:hypothetical protein
MRVEALRRLADLLWPFCALLSVFPAQSSHEGPSSDNYSKVVQNRHLLAGPGRFRLACSAVSACDRSDD